MHALAGDLGIGITRRRGQPEASPQAAVESVSVQTLPDLPTVTSSRLSLQDALRIAAANNLTLKQSRADAGAASASARSAGAQAKPSLSTTTYAATGNSSNILTTSPGVLPQNILGVPPQGFAGQNLMLMAPLCTGGKLRDNIAAAAGQAQAAESGRAAASLTVTEAVTEGYATALLQPALVDIAQARVTTEDEQGREIAEKAAAGRLAPVDLLREQAEQADARQALLAAQTNAQLALITLKTTLGVSQASQMALSDTLDTRTDTAPLPADLTAALRQTVDQQDAAAWLTLGTAAAQVRSAAKGVRAAQEASALVGLRYKAGKSVAVQRPAALSALTRAQGTFAQSKAALGGI